MGGSGLPGRGDRAPGRPAYTRRVGEPPAPIDAIQPLVGRDRERSLLDAYAARLADGPSGFVLRGESGIGKTALWRAAVVALRADGRQVLVARPAAEERALGLGGLTDLLGEHDDEVAALDPDDAGSAAGRATLTALRALAAEGPVVVAIDDLQWLDAASARALRFALRRLEAEPIGLLATARTPPGEDDPVEPWRRILLSGWEELEVGPLGLAELRRLLEGTAIPRPVLQRIHEVSGGNPLYALELARGPAGRDAAGGAEPLALPTSLRAAIGQRLASLPPGLAALLDTVAAAGPTPTRALARTLPEAELEEALAAAEREELLVVGEDRQVRFAHPLIGSVVYARLPTLQRRALHASLAAVAEDPDVRARHLALSADEPDAEIAALLEASAGRARRRGAAARAAELAGHAVRLTPDGDADAARRRTLAQVGHLAASGEVGRALELADDLIAGLPAGGERAEALILRAQLEDDDLQTGEALLQRALEEARDDALLRGRVLDMLGWLRAVFRGDVPAGVADLREAVTIADAVGDVDLQVRSLAALGHLEALSGTPRPDLMERAIDLEARIDEPLLWAGPRALLAKHRLWAGDLPEARALFQAVLDDAVRNGNERLRPYCLYDLALVDCVEGDLEAAEARLHLGLEAASDAEDAHVGSWLLYPLAHVDAWRGRAAEARSRAEGILEWAARRGEGPAQARARGLLGLLSLSEGDAETAAGELAEAARRLAAMGVGHPAAIPVLPDAVEALAACGRADEARELLGRLEAAARENGPWTAAAAARSRGHAAAGRRRTRGRARAAAAGGGAVRGPGLPSRRGAGRAGPRSCPAAGGPARAGRRRAGRRPRALRGDVGVALGGACCRGSRAGVAGPLRRRADADRAARRGARGGGPAEPPDRPDAVHERGERRGPPHPHLPQARHQLPQRARPPRGRAARRDVALRVCPIGPSSSSCRLQDRRAVLRRDVLQLDAGLPDRHRRRAGRRRGARAHHHASLLPAAARLRAERLLPRRHRRHGIGDELPLLPAREPGLLRRGRGRRGLPAAHDVHRGHVPTALSAAVRTGP